MADKPTIKENAERLKQIVTEKGFWGYKNRYREILGQVITKDTTYEELSDENRAILHHVTGMSEDKIKMLSELVYPKYEDVEESKTKIWCVREVLKCRSTVTYNPLPDDKRLNPLDEYIALLGLSLYMLKVYNGATPSEAPVLFRKEIRKFVHQHYAHEKYDGLLSLFNGNVVVDLSMYNVAVKMEGFNNELMKIPMLYEKGAHGYAAVKYYNFYRGVRYHCRDAAEFLRTYNYIDLNFPKKDIEAYLSSPKTYSILFAQLTDDMRNSLSVEQLEGSKKKVTGLIKETREINGDWSKTLLDHLNTLKKRLQDTHRKNTEYGLNDKMRLYLLKLISVESIGEDNLNGSAIHELYASILGTRVKNVKSDLERLGEKRLGYEKNYSLLVRNLERIYYYIERLANNSPNKLTALKQQIENDLIPQEDSLDEQIKTLNRIEFENEDLERRVRRATEDFHKKQKEQEEIRSHRKKY